MIHAALILVFFGCASASAEDPRLAKDGVRDCVEVAKRFMKSREYSGRENEQDLIGACRDVEALCVTEAGESLHPVETPEDKSFLELVRACRGRGMGKCLRELKTTVASYDRREIAQIKTLLKKCE
jgi:hypothetical protein